MSEDTLYKKVGRKYVPVMERDAWNYWPPGVHVVVCEPGRRSMRFKIEPDHAALAAAGMILEDKIAKIVVKAMEMRPRPRPITPEQKAAWDALNDAFGDDRFMIEFQSAPALADEIAKAIVNCAVENKKE